MLKLKYLFPIWKDVQVKNEHYTPNMQKGVVLHGSCYIFSRGFIYKHNECFYNETFMYYESYILHYLAQRENLCLVYEPEIKVLHHEDVSTNLSYKSKYSKSIFVNKCLLDSCESFIDIMLDSSKKIG